MAAAVVVSSAGEDERRRSRLLMETRQQQQESAGAVKESSSMKVLSYAVHNCIYARAAAVLCIVCTCACHFENDAVITQCNLNSFIDKTNIMAD